MGIASASGGAATGAAGRTCVGIRSSTGTSLVAAGRVTRRTGSAGAGGGGAATGGAVKIGRAHV